MIFLLLNSNQSINLNHRVLAINFWVMFMHLVLCSLSDVIRLLQCFFICVCIIVYICSDQLCNSGKLWWKRYNLWHSVGIINNYWLSHHVYLRPLNYVVHFLYIAEYHVLKGSCELCTLWSCATDDQYTEQLTLLSRYQVIIEWCCVCVCVPYDSLLIAELQQSCISHFTLYACCNEAVLTKLW